MSNPFGIGDMAGMGLPGGDPMQGTGILETLELVRKAWASFALPPAMAPTVDPDEIARRVAELKAIEQWLVMNLTMLRSTVQALEIQQATLATLRAFGAASARAGAPEPTPQATGSASGEPREAVAAGSAAPGHGADEGRAGEAPDPLNPVVWWDMLQKQFGQVAQAALAGMQVPAVDAGTAPAGPAAGEGGPASGTTRPGKGRKPSGAKNPGTKGSASDAGKGGAAPRGRTTRGRASRG